MTTQTHRFAPDKLSELSQLMHGYVERGEVSGLVMALCHAGEIHIEPMGNQDLESQVPMLRETIFRIASMTKPIVAVAAMILVERGIINLDDGVSRWLPELHDLRVLRSLESQLDDTVPLHRPITVRDLLTFKLGTGLIMARPKTYPIQAAIAEKGLMPSPNPPLLSPDEWIKNFASLPLVYQPGERWMYHTGSDVLSVLISRAAGTGLEDFLTENIFQPLGMKDTAFSVSENRMDRFATAYYVGLSNKLAVFDPARGGKWSSPPAFQSGGGGLVSTVDDYLAFGRMMLDNGQLGKHRILQESTIKQMLTDEITPEQKARSLFYPGFWDSYSWGLGLSIVTAPDAFSATTGRFGWHGGLGTSWYSDSVNDFVGIFMTQRSWNSPEFPKICVDFWTKVYQSF